MQRHADETMKVLRHDARVAGEESTLDALLAPPPPPIASEATVRMRAVKAFSVLHRGVHRAELYSGAAGTINDFPVSLAKRLGARLAPVPPGTELVGVPLRPGESVDD